MERQRTGNITDEEYLADYPNAIVDRDKAEYVAYASKDQEEEVAVNRQKSLEAVANMSREESWRDGENRTPLHSAQKHAEYAEQARAEADKKAVEAGAVYDRIKNL